MSKWPRMRSTGLSTNQVDNNLSRQMLNPKGMTNEETVEAINHGLTVKQGFVDLKATYGKSS